MEGVIGVIDLSISFMKHMKFSGISLWFAVNVIFWISAFWTVVNFFISSLRGGSE